MRFANTGQWKNHLRKELAVGFHACNAGLYEIIEPSCNHVTLHDVIRSFHGIRERIEDIGGGTAYLQRFALEQVISVNTAAAGGNASLIAMGDG